MQVNLPNTEIILRLEHVTFSYTSSPVVEDVSFSVSKGDFLAILGPNGSGKSTLLKLIAGLIKPDSGQIEIFGQDIERFNQWPRIGYMPQVSSVRPGFPATVEEVVLSGRVGRKGFFRRLDKADKSKVQSILEELRIDHLSRHVVGELSGGQYQRVMLARALACDPDLLLLDEPTASVDQETRRSIMELLNRMRSERGLSIINISHDLDTIRGYISRVIIFNKRIIFEGTLEEMDVHLATQQQILEAIAASDHHHG